MYYCLNISITLRTCRRTKGGLDIMLIKRVERLAERLYERLLKVKVSFPNCQGDSGEESGKNGYLHLDRSWISEFYTTRVGIYSWVLCACPSVARLSVSSWRKVCQMLYRASLVAMLVPSTRAPPTSTGHSYHENYTQLELKLPLNSSYWTLCFRSFILQKLLEQYSRHVSTFVTKTGQYKDYAVPFLCLFSFFLLSNRKKM